MDPDLKEVLIEIRRPRFSDRLKSAANFIVALAALCTAILTYSEARIKTGALNSTIDQKQQQKASVVTVSNSVYEEVQLLLEKGQVDEAIAIIKTAKEKNEEQNQVPIAEVVNSKPTFSLEGFLYYEVGPNGELRPWGQLAVEGQTAPFPDFGDLKVGQRLIANDFVFLRDKPTAKEDESNIIESLPPTQEVVIREKAKEITDPKILKGAKSGGWLRVSVLMGE